MKIRTLLIAALVFVGLLPVIGFTWFTYDQALDKEFADVRDRHLLLAKNLSAALSRYERDVRATVESVAISLENAGTVGSAKGLLKTLNIRSVSIINEKTGKTAAFISSDGLQRPEGFSPALLNQARSMSNEAPLRFSEVVRSEEKYNALHVFGRHGEYLIIACLDTRYFVELGKQVAFGEKGHAAIVDHKGNVLAHPLDSWIAAAKNISKISAVQRMLNGETGVEQFYSPALKGDMIAGLTAVAGPNWGVMIPQPVSELNARAFSSIIPLMYGLVMAVLIGVALLQQSFRWIARPLENLSVELSKQLSNGMPTQVPPSKSVTRVVELTNIVAAYNKLATTVQRSAQQLADKALQDPVTSIGNRSYFTERGQEQINERIALSKEGILILTDLDGFKEINDTRGHAVGDEFLNSYARGLYSAVKHFMDFEFRGIPGAHPIIGRIGGDEFAILLPLPSKSADLSCVGEKLRRVLPSIIEVEGLKIPCGISAGGAAYPQHGTCIDSLLRRADVALYKSKANGKNQFTLYNKVGSLGSRSETLSAVSQAIGQNELTLEYQPKFCLNKNAVTGVEALVRWHHPELGKLFPDAFLPALQQTHVIVQLGEWVIDRAMKDSKEFDSLGDNLNIAINIGVEHFSHDSFVEMLDGLCRKHGIAPERIQLELTEDVVDKSYEVFSKTVSTLQKNGFSIAIDDFGKGFSNLSRMAHIPADVIKLDRSLVCKATENSRIRSVLKSAVDMAHALGAQVIVEGVETLDEVRIAEEAGADALQGHYFSKALNIDELSEWLHKVSSSPQHRQMQKVTCAMKTAVG